MRGSEGSGGRSGGGSSGGSGGRGGQSSREEAARKGGEAVSRDREHMSEIGRKGAEERNREPGGGSYGVRASRGMSIKPAVVTVVSGRMRIVNFSIDTGIR